MKFNMINWVLETIVNILILIDDSRLSTILYVFIMSVGTPLVYFMGIEENRQIAKEHFKSHIKIFKKKNENFHKIFESDLDTKFWMLKKHMNHSFPCLESNLCLVRS